jgi:vitamin B12 transporter
MFSNVLKAGAVAPALPWSAVSAAVLCAVAAAAQAQESPSARATLEETVVAATRSEQRLSDVIADMTVIDRDQLDQQAGRSLEDVMAKLPGVQITRNGGPGTETGLYLRGASKQLTAVYIDGIRVDVQNGSGGAQWESLPVDLIERIEVLRGPAGAVYGSDALAGVVQVFTKRGPPACSPCGRGGRRVRQPQGRGRHQRRPGHGGLRAGPVLCRKPWLRFQEPGRAQRRPRWLHANRPTPAWGCS